MSGLVGIASATSAWVDNLAKGPISPMPNAGSNVGGGWPIATKTLAKWGGGASPFTFGPDREQPPENEGP